MMKIVEGFAWIIVTDKAKEIFNADLFQLYTLHDDGSEALIETFEDLNKSLENGLDIGIEVGHISTQDAKLTLESRGYFTENLWHIDDVKAYDETLTDDQCMEVLNEVMTSPYIMETINEQIEYTLNDNL
jgi:hypothetical protein